MRELFERFNTWIQGLSARERYLVFGAGGLVAFFVLSVPVTAVRDYMVSLEGLTQIRSDELRGIHERLKIYSRLNARYETLRQTFAKADMTYEQVTQDIDRMVKDAINSDNYDLRARPVSALGTGYEKQEFNLKIKSLTVEQLVKLLTSLEGQERPLFLGKLDVEKTDPKTITATLEISSIRKTKESA